MPYKETTEREDKVSNDHASSTLQACGILNKIQVIPISPPYHVSPMSKNRKSNRSWWREHFIDHPGFTSKADEAFVASGSGATKASKVYCISCLSADTDAVLGGDLRAVTEGRIVTPRSETTIQEYCELVS